MTTGWIKPLVGLIFLACTVVSAREPVYSAAPAPEHSSSAVRITRPAPDVRGGSAYRLIYRVPVPIEVMWKFKTDFSNDFLLSNKYIQSHRLVSRRDNSAVTEDHYSQLPAVGFTWQTTLSPDQRRLDFKLVNARQAGQNFHYGFILLEPLDGATRVTQEAYFDFLGASLWAVYPWGGGMTDFLTYSARWEQRMVRERMSLYGDHKP